MAGAVTRDLVPQLVVDLEAESADLLALLDPLDAVSDDAWSTPTPAAGWTVHDQVAHLAHFDWVTRTAIDRPTEFVRLRDALSDLDVLQRYVDSIGPANASRDGADMRAWWRAQGAALRAAVLDADPDVRVPWFGPAMSLASQVTARIMETWAHGQDVADALGVGRVPTDRLRHVARIGVLTLPHSFRLHGQEPPQDSMRIELVAPSGALWTWGDPEAGDAVTGAALDFCLVVTQRRHASDTDLVVRGASARAWIQVAQAFAGPPGAGRPPRRALQETS